MTAPYTVRYHPAAEQDLLTIYDYIENFAGARSALRTLDQIERITKSLAHFPYKGSIRAGIDNTIRTIPAAEKAVVGYTVEERGRSVFILFVSYAGSDWMAIASSRLD